MDENKTAVTEQTAEQILPEYKKTAYLIGTFVTICFLMRYVATVVIRLFVKNFADVLDPDLLYIIRLSVSGMFLQILPSVIGAFMFGYFGKKGRGIKALYTVPKRCAKAIGNFGAVYGLGQIVNILTMLVVYIATAHNNLNDSLNTMSSLQPPGMASAWFLLFMLAVIAPVFEEFIFRGVLMEALKPYGNGLAIFTTGILFGLYHGNINQVFYAAALGIALGYIANATGSIFPTTILHLMFNSISGIILLLLTTPSVQRYVMGGDDSRIPDGDMLIVAFYGIFIVCVLVLVLVGVVLAAIKIKQIRRYKVPKVCGEISNGKKAALLILTPTSIIAILLIADTFFGFTDPLFRAILS